MMKNILLILAITIGNFAFLYSKNNDSLFTKLKNCKTFVDTLKTIIKFNPKDFEKNDTNYLYLLLKVEKEINNNLNKKLAFFQPFIINAIAGIYLKQDKYDSVYYFLQKSLLNKFQLNVDDSIKGRYYFLLARYYEIKGEPLNAEQNYLKSIEYYKKVKNVYLLASVYSNLADLYDELGNIKDAIKFYFKALKLAEKANNKMGISKIYNNIGLLYRKQKDYEKALEYYYKSLQIKKEIGSTFSLAFSYNNIAGVYTAKKDYDSAVYYFQKAIEIFEKENYLPGVGILYNNLAFVNLEKKDYKKAIEYAEKSLQINKKVKNNLYIVQTYLLLSDIHKAIGNYYKALDYGIKAHRLAKQIKSKPLLKSTSRNLYFIYKEIKDYKNALKMLELFKELEDSLINLENQRAIIEKEKEFQYEKQKAIQEAKHKAELEKQKALAKEQQKKQRIIILSISSILIIIIIFSTILFGRYKIIQKQKETIEKQHKEIIIKNEQLSIQKEEIEQQNEELKIINERLDRTNKKLEVALNKIQEINKDLTDSIKVASSIQRTLLERFNLVLERLPDNFLLYLPRDVVSGDFYWIQELSDAFIVAVADCTGHGVPGALLSVIGIGFLNTIVIEEKITTPNLILNQLRSRIIETLHAGKQQEPRKEGMDISLLKIYKNSYNIEWAGANNPLYIISRKQNESVSKIDHRVLHQDNLFLYEIKADRFPVGYNPLFKTEKSFSLKTVILNKDDELFLFSDGFMDQFGGPKCEKLKSKNFKKLLMKIYTKPVNEQKELLRSFLIKWKGNCGQTDDITLMGIKV